MTPDERAAIEAAIYHILAGYNLHSRSGMISELVDALSPLLAAKDERIAELDKGVKDAVSAALSPTWCDRCENRLCERCKRVLKSTSDITAALSPAAEQKETGA